MKKTGFVFSHGHLDIEWYMPFRSFRFWFIKLMDMLIEICEKNPGYKTFVLDGQVAPLDDYLKIMPEKEAIVKKLVAEGRLSIGPFYTQFDEWLISGESIVRNCLYGNRRGRQYSKIMKAGHLPDNFGHPKQMPQILSSFGIGSLLFMRGMPDRPEGMKAEFWLQGPDGSRVLGVHFENGYGNAYKIWETEGIDPITIRTAPYGQEYYGYESHFERTVHTDIDKIARQMIEAAEEGEEYYPSGIIPLAAGCDHCPPQMQITDIVEAANRLQDNFRFVQGNCEDLVNAILEKKLDYPVFTEELW